MAVTRLDLSDETITALLSQLRGGKQEVESRLVQQVYSELRRIAARHMRHERGNHTLQPTALVNEVWLRMAEQPGASWQDRAHFFAMASRLMRQVLVDHARSHRAEKRGAGMPAITLEDSVASDQVDLIGVLAIHEAIERLEEFDPRGSRIVELHFFGGLSVEEMAVVLGISARTVKRDWKIARAWLRSRLSKES